MATHKKQTSNFIEFTKNALFPKFCFGCGRIGIYLCITCSNTLRPVDYDRCPVCEQASLFGLTHISCKTPHGLDGSISFFRYERLVKKIIVKLKYHLIHDAAQDIINAVTIETYQKLFFLKKSSPEIFLIPVPLHKKRKNDRGFNQSEELFKIFAEKISNPIQNNMVVRTKYTAPQAHMKLKSERVRNMIGAFTVVGNIKEKDIIICDDVWTTGATIKELCKELKKSGAKKVYALTIARVYV